MKPKFTEYERRQIQAMMRQQMPWRKNLVLGANGILRWTEADVKNESYFDVSGLMGTACKRWQLAIYKSGINAEAKFFNFRKLAVKQIDQWRYNSQFERITVSDCLKSKQYVIENTLPTGMQVMYLLDTLETEFKMTTQEMGELTHIVGGWSPNAWDNRSWGERYNRMKALWREVAKIIGQFTMALKGYDIFKMYGFDGHFVGFTEK